MKNFFIYMLFLTTVFAAQRTVLLEYYTATWCGPCATVSPQIKEAHNINSDKCVLALVHFSSSDPFYNPKCWDRLEWYNDNTFITGYSGATSTIQYIPTVLLDGIKNPLPYSVSNLTNEIQIRSSISTPITLNISGDNSTGKLFGTSENVGYRATITSENTLIGKDLRFIVYIIESGLDFSAPNGLQIHNKVVREILPDENGIPIDFSSGNDLSVDIEGTFETNNWNLDDLSIIGVIQDFQTGEVYQSTEISYYWLDTKDNDISIPLDFNLDNVYPNPFNPSVNIPFTIVAESPISLKVIDIIGKEVDTIIENISYSPGTHTVQWNATAFPTGTYFIKMVTPNGIKIRKAILLK